MTYRLILISLLFFSCFRAVAQQDSSWWRLATDTFDVQPNKLQTFGQGMHHQTLDSTTLQYYQSQRLSDVLQSESTFFVKNYGPSNISTLSGRGGGASHTAVLWEGIPIENPMLGQTDVSLLPVSFIDELHIQYGSSSALFGNSSIGGALHLKSGAAFGQGWHFGGNSSYGSFQHIRQQLQLSYSNKWYAGSVRSFYRSAQNNFPFKDINAFGSPKPIKRQRNAAMEQYGLLTTHAFKIKQHTISVKGWWQESYRQILPTLLQSSSEDEQRDATLRLLGKWQGHFEQQIWQVQSALIIESLLFNNAGIDSDSRFLRSINAANVKWYPHRLHKLHLGIQYIYNQALSTGYAFPPQQHRLALFAAYQWQTKNHRFKSILNIREELVDNRLIRPAVSLGGSWNLYKKWLLNIHLSHNYRLPTFNDLYWESLGNPDLRPEYSWNSEMGLNLPLEHNKYSLAINLTGFCNLIDNWILWTPNGSGVWRPENVQQVWSRGLEATLKGQLLLADWQLDWSGRYAWTRSTRTNKANQSYSGKQLIYTPQHNAQLSIAVRYKKTQLRYQHHFTSLRYVNNANTAILPFYHFANVRLSQRFLLQKMSVQLYGQVNNVFGGDYQIISNRPMPWQQFEIGLSIYLYGEK